MRVGRAQEGFTLLEIMVALMMLTILVSVSLVGLQKYRDRAAMLKDETNQKVIALAVRMSAYDNRALPASLSDLAPEHLGRAYAQVTEGKRPYTFLAFVAERMGLFDIAEAHPWGEKYLGPNHLDILSCPSDKTAPIHELGGISYAIHSVARDQPSGQLLSWLLNPANAGAPLIIECEDDAGTTPAFRHSGAIGKVSIQTTVGGDRKKVINPYL